MKMTELYAKANELSIAAAEYAQESGANYQCNTGDYQFDARIKLAHEVGVLRATIHQLYLDQLLLQNELSELRRKVDSSIN